MLNPQGERRIFILVPFHLPELRWKKQCFLRDKPANVHFLKTLKEKGHHLMILHFLGEERES